MKLANSPKSTNIIDYRFDPKYSKSDKGLGFKQNRLDYSPKRPKQRVNKIKKGDRS